VSNKERFALWTKLLENFKEAPQKDLSKEEYDQATVPWSGEGNTRQGTRIRGQGPPYHTPPPPHPRGTLQAQVHWDKGLGVFYWLSNNNRRTFYPPGAVLLQTQFTEQDLADLADSEEESTPQASELEDEELPDQKPEPEPRQEHQLIEVEQENPVTLATTSRNTEVPPLVTTPVYNTPLLGSTKSWTLRMVTPPVRLSPEPQIVNLPNLPPPLPQNLLGFQIQTPLTLPLIPVIQTPIQPMAAAANPVTVGDLTRAMNKLKGGTLTFTGTGDALGFKNRMNLLIATKNLTDDDDKLREWLGHLSGQALTWAAPYFDDIFNTTANYQRKYDLAQFLTAFDRTYAYYNLQEKSRKQLDELKQGSKSIGQYVQQFQSLVHHTGYGPTEILQRFLRGLDRQTRHDLLIMRADDTLENAIENAQRLALISSGSSDPWGDPGRNNRPNNYQRTDTNNQYVPMEIDASRMKGRPAVKCYNCGKLGHIRKNCRSPSTSILRRPQGPRRIRATDMGDGETGLPAPDDKIAKLEEQLTAQQDAISTMYKLMNKQRKEAKDF